MEAAGSTSDDDDADAGREAAAISEELRSCVRASVYYKRHVVSVCAMKVETEAPEGHVCTPARVSERPAPDCPSSEALRLGGTRDVIRLRLGAGLGRPRRDEGT